MDETVNTRLQAEIEQIVHPVRAMYDTKLKMREDLYGHLLGLCEEERRKTPDGDVAIRAALLRLGNREELRARLQKSVHWFERLQWYLNLEFLPFLEQAGLRRGEESDFHRAARIASLQAGIFLFVYGVLVGAILQLGPLDANGVLAVPHPYLGALWVTAVSWAICFAVHLLGPWIIDRAAEIGRRSLRWYLVTSAGGIFLLSCGLCQMVSIALTLDGNPQLRIWAAALCFVAGMLLGRLFGCQFHSHRSEEWLSLPTPGAAARPN